MTEIHCRSSFDGTSTCTVNVDELQFRPSVYGVVIVDNHVLLSPQCDSKQWGYDFPGGGIELGERLPTALVREIKEETGFDAEPETLIYVSDDFFFHHGYNQPFHSLLVYYTCRVTGGEISTAGFDEGEKQYAAQAEWVPLDKIDDLVFHNPVDSPALIHTAAGMVDNR